MSKLAFVGFGEAAGALVEGWGNGLHSVKAYDIKLDQPDGRPELVARCNDRGVDVASGLQDAVSDADLVFSTVTADQALVAAEAATPFLKPQAYWCDLNSCAPSSKLKASNMVERAGANYVDVAVMAPVYPAMNKVPMLLSGPHAEPVSSMLNSLPLNTRLIDGPVGAASSIKMLRSVMVKGLEALTAECTLAAVAAGVDEEVFASLNRSHSGSEWSAQASYNFERSVLHGKRRAAEMEEVAKTLSDLGLPNDMVQATVLWQRKLGDMDVSITDQMMSDGANAVASSLLPQLRSC